MIGILAQKGLSLFGRAAPQSSRQQPSAGRERLISLLDDLVDALEVPVLGSISSAAGMYKRNLIGFKA